MSRDLQECSIIETYRRRNSLKHASNLAPDVKKQLEEELNILNNIINQFEKGCHLCKYSLMNDKKVILTPDGFYAHKKCLLFKCPGCRQTRMKGDKSCNCFGHES